MPNTTGSKVEEPCLKLITIFLKNGPISASFCLFSSFPHYTILQIDESVDGVLGTRIWGGRMEGTDESTELCWQPRLHDFLLRFLS